MSNFLRCPWQRLTPGMARVEKNMSKKILLITFLTILTFLTFNSINAAGEPWANREWTLSIDEATILKGYTVIVSEDEFLELLGQDR